MRMRAADQQKLLELRKLVLLAKAQQEWKSLPRRLPDERLRPLSPTIRLNKAELVRIIHQCQSLKLKRRKKNMAANPKSKRPSLAQLEAQVRALEAKYTALEGTHNALRGEFDQLKRDLPNQVALDQAKVDPFLGDMNRRVQTVESGLGDLTRRLPPAGTPAAAGRKLSRWGIVALILGVIAGIAITVALGVGATTLVMKMLPASEPSVQRLY